ncbi:Peptide-N4-(N-acetyl-beta-glucosaminyl)asparagine amidase A [Capsicum baccatum]|uniref:Peptide-N4-(N-acetyl-beta-glucosaminyl)asparagine amidase A n=1 Tax=Capsicum baccatum TaxID=33114 RepID=A0A2G2V139_CAPBA|nr:Peptide-N4-(N-acetyl-beta-glucosaminyl)asparagine amidase A [Capsicum baccatum]
MKVDVEFMIVKNFDVDFDYGVDLIFSISRNVDLNDVLWFEIENSINVKLKDFKIPQNVYRALLEVYVSFHENDDSWYGNSVNEYEEKQREVKPNTQLSLESASLTTHAIANATNAVFKTNYQNTRIGNDQYNSKQCGNHYSGSSGSSGGYSCGNSHGASGHYISRSHLFCDYYKKSGHTKDKCYRLHGFPQDFKFTKRKNLASATNVFGGMHTDYHIGKNITVEDPNSQGLQTLTKDQYSQLMT